MKWTIFTGTWKLTNDEVERDVRAATREVLELGGGIVTGGATGVDYFCMDEVMRLGMENRMRVIIPAKLDFFISDYYKNWMTDPITKKDIDKLSTILKDFQSKNPSGLLEIYHAGGDITQEDYDNRHDEEVVFSDEVYAFQVNGSTGTQDTIDKARASGLKISLHKKYVI